MDCMPSLPNSIDGDEWALLRLAGSDKLAVSRSSTHLLVLLLHLLISSVLVRALTHSLRQRGH